MEEEDGPAVEPNDEEDNPPEDQEHQDTEMVEELAAGYWNVPPPREAGTEERGEPQQKVLPQQKVPPKRAVNQSKNKRPQTPPKQVKTLGYKIPKKGDKGGKGGKKFPFQQKNVSSAISNMQKMVTTPNYQVKKVKHGYNEEIFKNLKLRVIKARTAAEKTANDIETKHP